MRVGYITTILRANQVVTTTSLSVEKPVAILTVYRRFLSWVSFLELYAAILLARVTMIGVILTRVSTFFLIAFQAATAEITGTQAPR